jgi:hypothetical protein
MTTTRHSGKPELRTSHVDTRPIEITMDDHRNNPEFLKNHPNTIVLPRYSSDPISTANQYDSSKRNNPNIRSTNIASLTSSSLVKPKKPGETKDILLVDNRSDLLNNPDLLFNKLNDYQINEATEQNGHYLHHEAAAEENDPLNDSENNNHSVTASRYSHDAGSGDSSRLTVKLPQDLHIDPSSWAYVFDAQDGTTAFKASLVFNQDEGADILDDFDIIITQVVNP